MHKNMFPLSLWMFLGLLLTLSVVAGCSGPAASSPSPDGEMSAVKAEETDSQPRYRIIDFSEVEGVPCPCGTSRRAFIGDPAFPGTVHRTDFDKPSEPHYHKKLTELYYIVSCEPGSVLHLDDEQIPLRPDMLILIPPNIVHYITGTAKNLIVVLPKYDPDDEFMVERK